MYCFWENVSQFNNNSKGLLVLGLAYVHILTENLRTPHIYDNASHFNRFIVLIHGNNIHYCGLLFF